MSSPISNFANVLISYQEQGDRGWTEALRANCQPSCSSCTQGVRANFAHRVDSADSETKIRMELKDIIGPSSQAWMKALCRSFISSMEYREISHMLSVIEQLQERAQKLTWNHWWHTGQFDVPESSLSKAIQTVIKVLENLLLSMMEGADVNDLACRGLLLYQVAPDVTL